MCPIREDLHGRAAHRRDEPRRHCNTGGNVFIIDFIINVSLHCGV